MEKLEMLYEGKAKKVFKTDDDKKYIVEYKDDATAFNGVKKGTIVGKGVINNKMSAQLFTLLEKENIPTHFEKLLSSKEGTELKSTVLEFSYKNDELGDPLVNDYHIKAMELATDEQLNIIKDYTFKINDILIKFFREKKMKLIDFKLEFGLYDGKVILADEISPDTCRLWDVETNEKLDKDRFRRDLGNVEEAYEEVLSRLSK